VGAVVPRLRGRKVRVRKAAADSSRADTVKAASRRGKGARAVVSRRDRGRRASMAVVRTARADRGTLAIPPLSVNFFGGGLVGLPFLATRLLLVGQAWGTIVGIPHARRTLTTYEPDASPCTKIEADPAQPRYLLTEPWVGYRFVTGESD